MITYAELEDMNPANPELNKRIYAYWKSFFAGDFKSCLNYIYPPLFERIPRKRMLDILNRTFKKKSVTISTDLATVEKISKVVEADEGDYCRVDYTMLMAVQFKSDRKEYLPKTEAKKKKERAFVLMMYKEQYGEENAWYDEITKSYSIYIKNRLLAIKDTAVKEWSFMMLTEHALTEELIPESVLIILNN